MLLDDIPAGFVFRGYIPDGSPKQHIGIVLGVKKLTVKYCYGTTKFKKLYGHVDFVKIPADRMKRYFDNAEDTFIFLSNERFHDINLMTFNSRRQDKEYDSYEQIDADIFTTIKDKIRNSNNLSDRFKQEFFKFIEPDT
jgi:hypothetical protein